MFDSMAWGTSVDAPSIKLSPMSVDKSVTYVCGPYQMRSNIALEPTGLRCTVARGQRAFDFALTARWLGLQPAAQRGR